MKKFKKSLCLVLSCLMLISVFVVTPISASAKAKKPKLSKKSVTITRGKTYKLKLKNAKAKKVKWTSSKKSVATVKKGKITTKKAGKTTITAKYKGKKYKCKVTVNGKSITGKTFYVYKNGSMKIWLVRNGLKIACKKWISSNSSIASINSNGIVTAKKVGSVTITGIDNNGDAVKSTVKVMDPFKVLKDYICSHGRLTENRQYYYIEDSYTTKYGNKYYCDIYYCPSENRFYFDSDNFYDGEDDDYFDCFVDIPMNNGGQSYTEVFWSEDRFLNDTDEIDSDYCIEAKSPLNVGNYTTSDNLSFAVTYGSANIDYVNDSANVDLRNSIIGWEMMLNGISSNGVSLSLKYLGFSKL